MQPEPIGTRVAEDLALEAMLADLSPDRQRLVVRSEFACVAVSLVDPGGRAQLQVEDLRTRQCIRLDAIELESLAWAYHRDLAPRLDPSASRWTNRTTNDDEKGLT
jgi:hypothetical protein